LHSTLEDAIPNISRQSKWCLLEYLPTSEKN